MKTQLTKTIADHIINENQRLKEEIVYLKKDLKLLEDKMMQALDKLAVSLSSGIKDYKKLLLFNTPYQCLSAFVRQITTSAQFSISTAQQNNKLSSQNKKLNKQINQIKEQSQLRIRREQEIIQELNKQIQLKKQRLLQLQQNYQNLLKAKKVAEKELNQTKEEMKILRLKLYEEQRQKLTEIIVANKKQMVEFRREMEMEAYKQELEFKRQIHERQTQVRLLKKNVQELINSNLTASSDLTVLQKIVKPMRQTTQLKDQISTLKKQALQMKQDNRQKQNTIISLEGKIADITLSRDNLQSHNERISIQKNLLTLSLQQTTEELEKAIADRKALDLYYSQKWHSQFSKVRQNLEEKFKQKSRQLQLDYQNKKKEVEAQIQAYLQRLRIAKNQMNALQAKHAEILDQCNQFQNLSNQLLQDKNQLDSVVRQSQSFHTEELRYFKVRWSYTEQKLNQRIDNLLNSQQISQLQIQKLKSEFKIEKNKILRDKQVQVDNLKRQHQKQLRQQQVKFRKELEDLEKHYSNSKEAIQKVRLAQILKFEQKQKQLIDRHYEQLKQTEKLSQLKLQNLNQKLVQSDLKFQKIRKRRQDQCRDYEAKLSDQLKLLYQRQNQLIARDVELQEYKKMKDTYMIEISKLNEQITEMTFQKQSLQVQIEGINLKLKQKEQVIQNLSNKKYKFKQDLLQFEKSYKKQFEQLQNIHSRVVANYKRKITELQVLFDKRPIKRQHYEQIQSLQKINHNLKTQMHIKEAQNLILNEVKQYYEQKAMDQSHKKCEPQNQDFSINTLLMGTKSNLRETVKLGKPMYIKKYSNRKNRLISSSFKKIDLGEQNQQNDPKQVKEMKKYLVRQQRLEDSAIKYRNERVKSSMM